MSTLIIQIKLGLSFDWLRGLDRRNLELLPLVDLLCSHFFLELHKLIAVQHIHEVVHIFSRHPLAILRNFLLLVDDENFVIVWKEHEFAELGEDEIVVQEGADDRSFLVRLDVNLEWRLIRLIKLLSRATSEHLGSLLYSPTGSKK